MLHIIPIIKPFPRAPLINLGYCIDNKSISFINLFPKLFTLSKILFSITWLITDLATLVAKKFPPKVDPCVPGVIPAAASFVATTAPIGNPPPKPLAIAITSGFISDH